MFDKKMILPVVLVFFMLFNVFGQFDNLESDVNAAETTFYVSTKGSDSTGNGTQAKPWKSIFYACTKVSPNKGCTIKILAGTYTESKPIQVPEGVNLIGEGTTKTIIKSSYVSNNVLDTTKFTIQLTTSPKTVNGKSVGSEYKQTLSGFKVDGGSKKLNGAILVQYRNNVTLENVEVVDCGYTGIWIRFANNFIVSKCKVSNSSWGSSGYCTGNIMIGSSENGIVKELTIDDANGAGYGIKTWGATSDKPVIKNLKIFNSNFIVARSASWNGGSAPAFGIEVWGVLAHEIQIYNNYFNNNVSLSCDPLTPGIRSIRLHHNTIIPLGYAVELDVNQLEVDHNYIEGGPYIGASWNRKMKDILIHHNVVTKVSTQIFRFSYGIDDFKVYNNTFNCKVGYFSMISMYKGVSNVIDVKNNLIINTGRSKNSPVLELFEDSTVSGFNVMNNMFLNFTIGKIPAVEKDNIIVNSIEDIKLNIADVLSFGSFVPKAGSPIIDKGIDVGLPYKGKAPDIGAIEYGEELPAIGIVTPTPKPTVKPTVKPTPKVIVQDTFNSLTVKSEPKSWALIKTGGTVTVEGVPSPSDKSIKLNKNKTAAVSATRLFTAQSGLIDVEAKIRCDNVSSSKTYFYILDSSGKDLVRFNLESSKIKVSDGKSLYSLLNATAKKWYTLKVSIDTNKDTCIIFIDNKPYKSNMKLINNTSSVGKVKFEIPGSYKSISYLDNLKISKIA